jgi:hypothetical protein
MPILRLLFTIFHVFVETDDIPDERKYIYG